MVQYIHIIKQSFAYVQLLWLIIPLTFQGRNFCGLIIFYFSRIGKFLDTCVVINMCPHILYFVEHFSSRFHKRNKFLRSVSKCIDETTVHNYSLFVSYIIMYTQLHAVLDFLHLSCATLSDKKIVFGVHR